jgi:hypothetical protein
MYISKLKGSRSEKCGDGNKTNEREDACSKFNQSIAPNLTLVQVEHCHPIAKLSCVCGKGCSGFSVPVTIVDVYGSIREDGIIHIIGVIKSLPVSSEVSSGGSCVSCVD